MHDQEERKEQMADRLKKKRTSVRASTTKIISKVDDELSKESPDPDLLEEFMEQLLLKEDLLDKLDEEVEEGTKTEDLEDEVARSLEYKEHITDRKTKIRRVLRRAQGDANSVTSSEVDMVRQNVKLPKLVIEKYTGDISLWQHFWGQFETAVHRNPSLTKTDKFSYLRSYLTGAVANVVAGFPLTEANYDNAIQLLKKRFGRKDLVINAHMTKLLNLNPVKNASDVKALRYLYDNCEIQIRSLASMGVVSDTYGSLLCPILMKLIPEEMTLEFS